MVKHLTYNNLPTSAESHGFYPWMNASVGNPSKPWRSGVIASMGVARRSERGGATGSARGAPHLTSEDLLISVKGQRLKVKGSLNGQTLIETVTALAVVIILVSSLVTVSIASVRSATLTSNKSTAAQLAYQQLEQARTARDSTYAWSAFTALFALGGSCVSTSSCFASCTSSSCIINTSGPGSYLSGGTTFAISVYGNLQSDGVHATSVVSWTDSLGVHNEPLSTIFTNWR